MDNLDLTVMKRSTAEIIKCIGANDPMTVADELFSIDLLPENVYYKISNESHPTDTAREITRAVTKKVEYQQLNFLKFIDVLKKTNMVAIADTLEKRSQKEKLQPYFSESPSQHSTIESHSSSNTSVIDTDFAQGHPLRKRLLSDCAPEQQSQHPRIESCSSGNGSDIETDNPQVKMNFDNIEVPALPVKQPECKQEAVLKVIRHVSSENLCTLQLLLIQHEHEKNIIDYINERQSYVLEKYDCTVHFWFQIGNPSWDKLIESLNACNENVLAAKVESGEMFEDSDPTELEGIHHPTKPAILTTSNVVEMPTSSPETKKGKDIISTAYSDLKAGYNELKFGVCKLLQERNVAFKDFLEYAKCHFSAEIGYGTYNIEDYFKVAQRVGELNMWHYGSLEDTLYLIFGKFDEKSKLLINEYEGKLTKYLTTTKIIDSLKRKDKEDLLYQSKPKKSFQIHDNSCCEELGIKIDITIEEKSLQYVFDLWKSLQRRFYLTPITVVLEDIREGCVQVVWIVPKGVSNSLSQMAQKAVDYFTSQQIRVVWITGECVYHKDIHASKDSKKAQFWLAQACENGRKLEVNAMLEVPGIDINISNVINGRTPLMLAAEKGYVEIVETLLQHDASPNIKEDTLGRSALFFAAEMGHENVVKILLEHGADVLKTNKDGSPILDIVPKSSTVYQLIDETTTAYFHLFQACETGDLQKVRSLVAITTTNVETIRSDGKTPLMVAAQHGFSRIVECLLSCEPNVLIRDDSGAVAADYAKNYPEALKCLSEETMFSAAALGNVEVLRRMLDFKTDPNTREKDEYRYTPLLWACEKGRLEAVEVLLQNEADPNAESTKFWTGLLLACRNKHYSVVKTLLERKVDVNKQTIDGWTALMLVASDGNKEIIELLLDLGADPELQDQNGFTALLQAAQNGHYEVVKLLVERNPHIKVDEYRTIVPDDWSAIMFATKNGHIDIVKFLVDKDANAHRQNMDGLTVLHIASFKGHKELVKYFSVDLKLDVNAQDQDGFTPMMYAARTGNLNVVKLLREKHAKIDIPENDIKWTAPFIAMQGKHQDVLDYLLLCDVNLDHKDSEGHSLMHLSLIFNREAFRSINAKYIEKAAELKKPSSQSVQSIEGPSTQLSLKSFQSQQDTDYSYFMKVVNRLDRNIGIAAA